MPSPLFLWLDLSRAPVSSPSYLFTPPYTLPPTPDTLLACLAVENVGQHDAMVHVPFFIDPRSCTHTVMHYIAYSVHPYFLILFPLESLSAPDRSLV